MGLSEKKERKATQGEGHFRAFGKESVKNFKNGMWCGVCVTNLSYYKYYY